MKGGYEPKHIVYVADSAGVNIALTALLALRAQGQAMPAGLVGIGGWIDLTERVDSRNFSPLDPLAGFRNSSTPRPEPILGARALSRLKPIRSLPT